jgi:nitrogen fixation protein FixH
MGPTHHEKPRELTGRTVLICLLAFFGVVFAVNAVMVRAATSTFGGVEAESAYRAGLLFEREIAAARAQDRLRWQVDGRLASAAPGRVAVDISVRDPSGLAPSGIALTARLAHPGDARHDAAFALTPAGAGRFRGVAEAERGQWTLVITINRGGERVYLSRSRVTLR